jgi:hypothetical protein
MRIALTATCAANLLGVVAEEAFARGNAQSARRAFELLAQHTAGNAEALARRVLEIAVAKLRAALDALIADYSLDAARVTIVGGGGGCGALIPELAAAMKLPYRIARDAEVIAPIGVALALVRDVVERTIAAPSPAEIASIRREAADRVVAAGASPDRVVVEVEIDSQRSKVIATASGATALVEAAAGEPCTEEERRAIAGQSLNCDPAALELVELTSALSGYELRVEARSALRRHDLRSLRVIDERGVVRLALAGHRLARVTVGNLDAGLPKVIDEATQFGDVGRALPAVYLLRGARVAAFDGLTSAEQAVALAAEELHGCATDEPIVVLVEPREA